MAVLYRRRRGAAVHHASGPHALHVAWPPLDGALARTSREDRTSARAGGGRSYPDRGYLGDRAKRELYVEFLDAVQQRETLWKALPREVAKWWRQRDAKADGSWPIAVGRAWLDDDTGEVSLEPQAAYR